MRMKFEDRSRKALKPRAVRHDASDMSTAGLRLRVSPSGVKTFVLALRDPAGKMKRITPGRMDSAASPVAGKADPGPMATG